jgi:hypothetical protein
MREREHRQPGQKRSAQACGTSVAPDELRICGQPGQTQRPHWVVVEWKDRRQRMLETIAIILIVLWLLGVVSGYTLGNFIYLLSSSPSCCSS